MINSCFQLSIILTRRSKTKTYHITVKKATDSGSSFVSVPVRLSSILQPRQISFRRVQSRWNSSSDSIQNLIQVKERGVLYDLSVTHKLIKHTVTFIMSVLFWSHPAGKVFPVNTQLNVRICAAGHQSLWFPHNRPDPIKQTTAQSLIPHISSSVIISPSVHCYTLNSPR